MLITTLKCQQVSQVGRHLCLPSKTQECLRRRLVIVLHGIADKLDLQVSVPEGNPGLVPHQHLITNRVIEMPANVAFL